MVTVLYADGDQMYGGWLASLVGLGLLAGEIIGGLLATPLGKTKFQMIGSVAAALVFFACGWITLGVLSLGLIFWDSCRDMHS